MPPDRPLCVEVLRSVWLAGQPLEPPLKLGFNGRGFRLFSNSGDVLRNLADYYRPYRAGGLNSATIIHAIEREPPELDLPFTPERPSPGKTRYKHEYADLPDGRLVRKRATGMVFAMGRNHSLTLGPCRAHLQQVINFIHTRYIESFLREGALLCHAAAVALGERGLVIAGPSGSGKSTLALHLLTHGADFVTNDRLLVQREGHELNMWGVPKCPRVNPGTLLSNDRLRGLLSEGEQARLRRLAPQELWTLEQKYDVRVEDVFGPGRVRLSARLTDLVVLDWRRTASPMVIQSIDLKEQPEFLLGVMKPPGIFYPNEPQVIPPQEWREQYVSVFGTCPAYRITGGGDFEPAICACMELLTSA
jgi:HprK-related kinase B